MYHLAIKSLAILVVAIIVHPLQASVSEVGKKLRLVALTGSDPVGLPDGRATRVHSPKINSSGLVAFKADNFRSDASVYYEALLAESEKGLLRTVAESGSDVPGLIGMEYAYFPYQPIAYTNSNQLIYEAALEDFGTYPLYHGGLWQTGDGSDGPLVHWNSGRDLPASPSNFYNVYESAANSAGQLVFKASKESGANFNNGLWRVSQGLTPEKIVAVGEAAPGIAGSTFRNLRNFAINELGKTIFRAYVNSSGGGNGIDTIYAEGEEGLFPVVTEGMAVPGSAGEMRFSNIGDVSPLRWNALGEVAFDATTSPNMLNGPFRSGIWKYSENTGLTSLVRIGDPVPNTSGATFKTVSAYHLDDSGRLLFGAGLAGPGVTNANGGGIWQLQDDGQTIVKIAQNGDAAPGGGQFHSYWAPLQQHKTGQVVLHGFLGAISDGQSVPPHGVWATDRRGTLRLILKTGTKLDFGNSPDSSLREINDVVAGGINDSGELVLSVQFTDGTRAIVVSRQVAIPEPSSLALSVLVAALAASNRFRKLISNPAIHPMCNESM